MIKFCNECAYGKVVNYDVRCFNPLVNKKDAWALTNKAGVGYGSDTRSQRESYSFFWSEKCGTQGKHWKLKVEKSIEQLYNYSLRTGYGKSFRL